MHAAAGNSDINYSMTLPADSARSDMSATSWRPRSEAVGFFFLSRNSISNVRYVRMHEGSLRSWSWKSMEMFGDIPANYIR